MPISRELRLERVLNALHLLRENDQEFRFPDKIRMSTATMDSLGRQARYDYDAGDADAMLNRLYGVPIEIDDNMPFGSWKALDRGGNELDVT